MGNNEINCKLLHKNSQDDVLVSNPQRAIPYIIDLHKFSCELNDKQMRVIENHYMKTDNGIYQIKYNNEPSYTTNIEIENRHHLGLPYQIVSKHISKDSIQRLVELLTYYNIASTSFDFINNADHYFFYRKAHEHVPGIMLMEAARQTIYYHLYTYSVHDIGAVTVSLEQLTANFFKYIDLMYPVEVLVDNITDENSSSSSTITYNTRFYQNQKLTSSITTVAPVINMKQFKSVRNIYLLNSGFYKPVLGNKLFIKLDDILLADNELEGFSVSDHLIRLPSLNPIRVGQASHIDITDRYGMTFSASIKPNINENYRVMEFSFVDAVASLNLKEMIKTGFVQS